MSGMSFAAPVFVAAVEPENSKDVDKLDRALARLVRPRRTLRSRLVAHVPCAQQVCGGVQAREDPSFHYAADEETGQLLLKGCGELHLEVSASQCPSTLTTATPPPAPRPPPNTHTLRTLYTHSAARTHPYR
jgi:hypothetical protein